MNWADYLILGIILLSGTISFVRGFLSEALSLAVWIVAIWLALTFSKDLSVHLIEYISTPSIRIGVAFASLFLIVLVLGAMVNYLIIQIARKTGISGTDRMLGIFFGIARGGLLISLLTLLAGITPFPSDPWWQQSILLHHFQDIAIWMRSFLPADVAKLLVYY